MTDLDNLAHKYDAYIRGDGRGFRRKARILQSIWREEQGIEPGQHKGPLGSRLPMPDAKNPENLTNYLTENIREVVRNEVLNPEKSKGKLFAKPRIFNDLLSSQPLCFNLFGELQLDLAFPSAVFRQLTSGRLDSVTAIEFEWSPGKANPKYTNDKSAFDVYILGKTFSGGDAFVGIEVKYHENLRAKASPITDRYKEIFELMNCFRPECIEQFKKSPLHQIWRDHLLAGVHRLVDPFDDDIFVFLYPKDNTYCSTAAKAYKNCLTTDDTFETWTLERVVDVIKNHTSDQWIDQFYDRYLNFNKLEDL